MSTKKILTIAVVVLLMVSAQAGAGQIYSGIYDVPLGSVNVTLTGFDSSVWHPGSIGQQINLTAGDGMGGLGSFVGTMTVNQGNYGSLQTYVNLNSYAGGAGLEFTDYQDFNVLSANHINNVEGYFYAAAMGNNGNVQMNLKSIGSMYVWSEATNPGAANPLQGNYIEKHVWTTQSSVPKTDLQLLVVTSGLATMSNSAAWGWTNGETGTSNTNYSGGTRNVSATGTGTLVQNGFGANFLSYSASYTMPGGGTAGGGAWNFNPGGISGTYCMSAN